MCKTFHHEYIMGATTARCWFGRSLNSGTLSIYMSNPIKPHKAHIAFIFLGGYIVYKNYHHGLIMYVTSSKFWSKQAFIWVQHMYKFQNPNPKALASSLFRSTFEGSLCIKSNAMGTLWIWWKLMQSSSHGDTSCVKISKLYCKNCGL